MNDKCASLGNLHLSGPQAANIMAATSFLNAHYGIGFDTHVVIAHECCGIMDHEAATQLLWLLFHRMQKWFRRRQMDAFYVYVHENSRDRGFHTHVLLHAGAAWAEMKVWLRKAVERLWGGPLPSNMLHIKHRRQRQLSHRVALQWIWVRYLLKGIWPGLAVLDVDKRTQKPVHEVLKLRPRPGGLVQCRKRAGVSSNLGRRERDKAGYASLFELGMDDRLFSGDEFRLFEDTVRRAEADKAASQLQLSLASL